MKIAKGDFVEIMGGKFKGEIDTVIIKNNNSITVDLGFEAVVLNIGMVRLV